MCSRNEDMTPFIINRTEHRSIDDEPLLALAASEGRALLTFNVRDFVPLISLWVEIGREHAGVILSKELPPSELLKRVEKLLTTLSADDLTNTARWLSEFKPD